MDQLSETYAPLIPQETKPHPENHLEARKLIDKFNNALREPEYSDFINGKANVPKDKAKAYIQMPQDERAGLYAYLNLPKDQESRVNIIRRAKNGMDSAFKAAASGSLHEYFEHGPDIRMAWGEDWRQLLGYDEDRVALDESIVRVMDELNIFLRVPPAGQRSDRAHRFFDAAQANNLLTATQREQLTLTLQPMIEDAEFRDQVAELGYAELMEALRDPEESSPLLGKSSEGKNKEDNQKSHQRSFVERPGGVLTKRKKRNRESFVDSMQKRTSTSKGVGGIQGAKPYRQGQIEKLKHDRGYDHDADR